jgi:hypothetical protein
MEETVAEVLAGLGGSPAVTGILIVVLVVGILLLIIAFGARKWAQRCYDEQKRLNVHFEDQMFLLGKFHEELASFKRTLSGGKESLQGGENLESFTESIPSDEGTKAEVSPVRLTVVGDSTPVLPPREEGDYSRQIEEGKRLIERKVEETAREFNIQVRGCNWYKKPSMLSEAPYILMISVGDKPRELGFSEKEIVGFDRNDETIQNRLRSLMKARRI